MQESHSTLRKLLIFLSILNVIEYSNGKVLQITNKNLPNVLRTMPQILVLYHHSDCQYSINYKQKFTNYYLNNPDASSEIVGIVDCSQQNNLCKKHHIISYPTLKKQYQNQTSELYEADLFLATLIQQYQQADQYLTNKITQKLKTYPHFVVVLFQQEGMPVPSSSKIKNNAHIDRIFYLSEGRLAATLAGFVKNRGGCWIYQLQQPINGQISHYSCGDTYQSASSLSSTINRFFKNNIQKHEGSGTASTQEDVALAMNIQDESNHENETILGYKQLVYWLKHYDIQLQISTHSRISMCSYLYIWSRKCEHCNYQFDMQTVKRTIDKVYSADQSKEVLTKYKVYSYQITGNKLQTNTIQLAKIAGLNYNKTNHAQQNYKDLFIIPNLVAMCFSTYNNRVLPQSARFNMFTMNKIIASENIETFTQQIVTKQINYSMQKQDKQKSEKQTNQL